MTTSTDPIPLFTIGHSNHSFELFFGLLQPYEIDTIVDVRTAPFSRFTPHFNYDRLTALLEDRSIRYVFLGRELGGRPTDAGCYDETGRVIYNRLEELAEFKEGVDEVALLHRQGRRVALMCSEEDPLRCHRFLSVAHVLTGLGFEVAHIRADGRLDNHADIVAPEPRAQQVSMFDEEAPLRKSLLPVSPARARNDSSRS